MLAVCLTLFSLMLNDTGGRNITLNYLGTQGITVQNILIGRQRVEGQKIFIT